MDGQEKLDDMLPPEGDEEAKEGKGLKFLTPNKLLTRLTILLVQIAGKSKKKQETIHTN